jgi:hypothetical protein
MGILLILSSAAAVIGPGTAGVQHSFGYVIGDLRRNLRQP